MPLHSAPKIPHRAPRTPWRVPIANLEALERRLLLTAAVTFDDRHDYPASGKVNSIAVGDFNGDGLPDIAATNFEQLSLDIFLNQGKGNFSHTGTIETGRYARSIQAADINSDGKIDLVFTTELSNNVPTIALLPGNGDGTFGAAVSVNAGVSPKSVALADFNGDGKIDIAVTNDDTTPRINLLLNDGHGAFPTFQAYSANAYTGIISVADVNGDRAPDLVTAGEQITEVFVNQGDGSFAPPVDYSMPYQVYSLAVADFNGDHKPDLAIGTDSGDWLIGASISFLINNGDGTFSPGIDRKTAFSVPTAICPGDFNGDGKTDFAWVSNDNFWVVDFINNGDGTFTEDGEFGCGLEVTSMLAPDLNGDGQPDLVTGTYRDQSVETYLNESISSFGVPVNSRSWNQGGPMPSATLQWNEDVPIDPLTGERSLTGCVATAIAQVAYYWHFPQSLFFNANDAYVSHATDGRTIPVDSSFSKYDFPSFNELNNALANIAYDGSEAEMAMLSFAVGIKVREQYSSIETLAALVPASFGTLGFQSARIGFNWNALRPTVIANIKAGLPVVLGISGHGFGHAIILDGYRAASDTFHADFGWGGDADGWYSAPDFSSYFADFKTVTEVLYDIRPVMGLPASVTATDGTFSDHVHITWDSSEDALGYEVWRSATNNPADARRIATTGPSVTSYDDSATSPGQAFYYWIRATSSAGMRGSDLSAFARGSRKTIPQSIQLAFITQPTDTVVGTAINPSVTVAVQDSHGNTLNTNTSIVRLELITAGGVVKKAFTATARNGLATFNLTFGTRAGRYFLRAVVGGMVGTSSSFTLLPGPAASLVFFGLPTRATVGDTLQFYVAFYDKFGNLATGDSSVVTLGLLSPPAGVTLGGTTSLQAHNGMVLFDDISLTRAGRFRFTASNGLLPVVSSALLTMFADPSTLQLAILQTPSTSPANHPLSTLTVAIVDAYGNILRIPNLSFSVFFQDETDARLKGVHLMRTSSGTATFTGLSIDRAGTYSLQIVAYNDFYWESVAYSQLIT